MNQLVDNAFFQQLALLASGLIGGWAVSEITHYRRGGEERKKRLSRALAYVLFELRLSYQTINLIELFKGKAGSWADFEKYRQRVIKKRSLTIAMARLDGRDLVDVCADYFPFDVSEAVLFSNNFDELEAISLSQASVLSDDVYVTMLSTVEVAMDGSNMIGERLARRLSLAIGLLERRRAGKALDSIKRPTKTQQVNQEFLGNLIGELSSKIREVREAKSPPS
ncbi:hypothetical protein [Maricaulis sp.]|uniref:hypothetical protein n=1 Tax=Maricaulis sp. TaxID=1486257 RepID=UPI003A9592E3